MRILSTAESKSIHAGKGISPHFHWICLDKRFFISKPYYNSITEVGEMADRHREKYRSHNKKVFVFTCYRKCGK